MEFISIHSIMTLFFSSKVGAGKNGVLVAATKTYILHYFEGHKLESHGIFCFYNCGENSDKIFNMRTSPLRFNVVLATKHQ